MLEALNSFYNLHNLEIVKALLSLVVSMSVLAAGWFVGNKLSLQWSLRQKKRELELASLNKLYELFGEFFAVWKLWDQKWITEAEKQDASLPEDYQWLLLQRACAVEGQVQAFLMKLVAERDIGQEELKLLGQFRQAFQVLRQSIRKNKRLEWRSSVPSEYPKYASFKILTYKVACFLFDSPAKLIRGTKPDGLTVLKVTSNHWEANWVDGELIAEIDKRYKEWRSQAPTVDLLYLIKSAKY